MNDETPPISEDASDINKPSALQQYSDQLAVAALTAIRTKPMAAKAMMHAFDCFPALADTMRISLPNTVSDADIELALNQCLRLEHDIRRGREVKAQNQEQ
jgi:hypothetical protein